MSYPVSPPPAGRHQMSADPWPNTTHAWPGSGQDPPAAPQGWRGGIPDNREPGGWGGPPDYRSPAYAPPAPPTQAYPPPRQAYAPGPTAEEEADDLAAAHQQWADVRRQVALEVKAVNAKHCHEAFDLIGKRGAVAPNGVILFYTAPDRNSRYGYRLYRVTRLAFAGPEYDDLARMLNGLTGAAVAAIARAQDAGRRWDPRGPDSSLVNGGDTDMPRDATFIGTAAETLNTDHADWYTVTRSILNQPLGTARPMTVFDLTGQGFVRLIDGTVMQVIRDNNRRVGDDGVLSNRSLDGFQAHYGNRFADLTERGTAAARAAWAELTTLHMTLYRYLSAPAER